MSAAGARLTWTVSTAWPARGAIAVIQVCGDARGIDELLEGLGAGAVTAGRVAVRDVAGIDRCVLARFDDRTLYVFPHAGKRILERIGEALGARGVVRVDALTAREAYPEAEDEIEARMLAALAGAASALAIDVLVDQPRRWREVERIGEVDAGTARALGRLIRAPLVAAVGLANVGKSSVLNALAGRNVSVVADGPGTTRDHVGATLDLGGLTVRWVDCPGFGTGFGGLAEDGLQAESQRLAMEMAGAADLLVVCGDGVSGFPDEEMLPEGVPRLRAALRSDLGLPAGWVGAGVEVSVREGRGVGRMVEAVRERLVPEASLKDGRAWRFWDGPGDGSAAA